MNLIHKYLSHTLCAIVGISAWIEINGLFTELTHMTKLPEGWSLASIMVVIVQIGNVVPLFYWILPKKPSLRVAMVIVLLMGIGSLVFLATLWSETRFIAGKERSVMLYIGTFLSASADCLSNLVFWPYVGQFSRSYITAMGTGESLSSAVAAIVSSTQKGIGYGPSTFFVILIVIVVICSLAFIVFEFQYAPGLRRESIVADTASEGNNSVSNITTNNSDIELDVAVVEKPETFKKGGKIDLPSNTLVIPMKAVWLPNLSMFSVIMGIAFVQNALNHSLLPFACRYYKDARYVSQTALFISTPVASISASFFQPKTSLLPAVFVWICTSVFIVIGASLEDPMFSDQKLGVSVMAIVSILSGTSLAYSKVCAMLALRSVKSAASTHYDTTTYTRKVMTSAGVSMQIGSIVGAVTMYCLVNVGQVFSSKGAY